VSKGMPKRTGKEFVWTDDEVELLLNIANDYKISKAAESWTGNQLKASIPIY